MPLAAVAALAAGCGGAQPGVARVGGTSTSTSSAAAPSSARQSGLLYARCMRAHGVSNFPDPVPGGGLDVSGSVATDLKSNPRYHPATLACQADLPGGGPAGKLRAHPSDVQHALEFAGCMRSHGIADFPDPDSQGIFRISGDIDTSSPQFAAAQDACEREYGPIPIAIASGPNGS